MSDPAAMKPMTRLLIQKQAVPDENASIALSVLRDSGWSIEAIGLEISVSLSRTTYRLPDAEPDVNSGQAQALEASRLIVAELQRDLDARRGNGWALAGAVAAVCAFLALSGLGGWCWTIVGPVGPSRRFSNDRRASRKELHEDIH
jgi:hypothetical protein